MRRTQRPPRMSMAGMTITAGTAQPASARPPRRPPGWRRCAVRPGRSSRGGTTCPGTGCLTEQFTYDYNILKPLTYTDLNGNKTSLTYYPDPLDRLLNVTRPDTGQTSFTYSDAPGTCATGNQSTSCPSVQSKQDLTSAGDKVETQTDYDGLGRKEIGRAHV